MRRKGIQLKHLFSSGLRVKVLSYLFGHPGETVHVRGLASAIEESAGTVSRELANLEWGGTVGSVRMGNQKRYSLRRDSAIYDELRTMFLKTTMAGEAIREAMVSVPGIEVAFIHGSFASGEASVGSDIDVFVVGDVRDKTLAPVVARVERRLKREVNYVVFARRELERRLQKPGDFVHEVFAGPSIVLVGSARDRLFRTP